MPYSAGRMLASIIAYFARNSAGRIYPSLFRCDVCDNGIWRKPVSSSKIVGLKEKCKIKRECEKKENWAELVIHFSIPTIWELVTGYVFWEILYEINSCYSNRPRMVEREEHASAPEELRAAWIRDAQAAWRLLRTPKRTNETGRYLPSSFCPTKPETCDRNFVRDTSKGWKWIRTKPTKC